MPTYRIDLAYDGSGFRGYAANPGMRTVQGVLEEVLARVLQAPVETTVAGRTDAGVHARGQVVSFVTEAPVDPGRVQSAITGLLGPEVVARAVAEAPGDFNARFSARSRSYRYSLDTGPVPDPSRRRTAWHVPDLFDLDAMNRAAAAYLGEHDFASLCRAAEGKSTVRRVLAAEWHAVSPEETRFEVTATAFCHQMVRSMVALCVAVGRGRLEPEVVPEILAARNRNAARGAAPPHALTLWSVEY